MRTRERQDILCVKMEELQFNIVSNRVSAKSIGLDIRPNTILPWLAELPLTNAEKSATTLADLIARLNQSDITAIDRHFIVHACSPVVVKLTETLHTRYIRAALPLSDKNRKIFNQVISLNADMVCSYKTVVVDLQNRLQNDGQLAETYQEAIYGCIYHIALLIMEHYLVYAEIPRNLWREFHQHYAAAVKMDIQELPLRERGESGGTESISLAYKRAILMALSNPYHLMQGEVETVFKMVGKLTHGIQINPILPGDVLSGQYIIDLAADSPPAFCTGHNKNEYTNPRQLNLTMLIEALHSHIVKLHKESGDIDTSERANLALRIKRDMLTRLNISWARQQERKHERIVHIGRVNLNIGMSTSHFILSDKQVFSPELDEIKFHNGGALPEKSLSKLELSLVPLDHEPWKNEEAQQRILSGVDSHRTSNFDTESHALDTWEKIYAVKTNRDDENLQITQLYTRYQHTSWDIRNISEGGMAVFCETTQCIPVRVGEIVSYESERKQWNIGAIRWIRSNIIGTLEMGLMFLSSRIHAIATRAIEGTGKGSEYVRSLLLDADDLYHKNARILLPAAIFDVNTSMVVCQDGLIKYILLTKYLFGTNSFALYEFKVIDRPYAEERKIAAMRQMF